MTDQAKENRFHINTTEKTMISGGVAGSVGKTITAPLSRLTILYQVGSMLDGHHHVKFNNTDSLWKTSRNILKTEGILAFWKGNLTAVIHRFPYSAVNFYSYEIARSFLCRTFNTKDTPMIRFVSGGFSGLMATGVCYPLELIRTRVTVHRTPPDISTTSTVSNIHETSPHHSGDNLKRQSNLFRQNRFFQSKIYSMFTDILKQDGIYGLYRGLSVSLCVSVPTLAIGFTVYGQMKQTLLHYGGIFKNKHNNHLSVSGALLSGIVSGCTSSIIMFPADVVRKRMQVSNEKLSPVVSASSKTSLHVTNSNSNNNLNNSSSAATEQKPLVNNNGNVKKIHYSNTTTINATLNNITSRSVIWSHLKGVLQTDGIKGMYRGIVPELLKVCPMVAITFCTYELTADFLNEHFPTTSNLQESK